MIKGLYSAASAMIAQTQMQQSLAHNIANLTTPGFKQVMNSLDDFMITQVNTPALQATSQGVNVLGSLGLGVMDAPESTDFSQGSMQTTGNELDLAIEGSGFFRVRTPDGERYTRDGRFLRDANGLLVTVDGYAVLNNGGQPITLPAGTVDVQTTGAVTVNNNQVAQIGMANFQNPETDLERGANNTFSATTGPTGTATGTIHQGYLEASNANASQIATQMVTVARSYEAAQRMVQAQDELLGETIASLGKIS